uniref:hypothetical protein n=1 Tax=Escherichia coli TaxID=562 RepID=UPI001A7E0572
KKAQQVGGSHHQKHHTPRKNKFLLICVLNHVINEVYLYYIILNYIAGIRDRFDGESITNCQ